MRKLLYLVAFIAIFLVVLSSQVLAGGGDNNPHNMITICHALGNGGFIQITPNANGDVSGHAGNSHQDGKDIIPPFEYNDDGETAYFPGQNWDEEGIAIWENGCDIPEETETPPPPPPTCEELQNCETPPPPDCEEEQNCETPPPPPTCEEVPDQDECQTPPPPECEEDCEPVYGCTDPGAANYNPEATKDDESCVYRTPPPPPTVTEVPPNPYTNCPTENLLGLLYGVDYSLEGGGDVRVKEDGTLDFYSLDSNVYTPGVYNIYLAATGQVVGQVTINDLGLPAEGRCDIVVPENPVSIPEVCDHCGPAVCSLGVGMFVGVPDGRYLGVDADGNASYYNTPLDALNAGLTYAGDECSVCGLDWMVHVNGNTLEVWYGPGSTVWDTAIAIELELTGNLVIVPDSDYLALAAEVSAQWHDHGDVSGGWFTVEQ